MDNKTFNAEESIRIIEQTIQLSARHLEERSGKALLLWGYLSVATSLAVHFCLPHFGAMTHLLWLLIPIVGYTLAYLLGIPSKQVQAKKGFAERFLGTLWLVLGLSNSLVGIYLGMYGGQLLGGDPVLLILAYVCLSCSMGMLITGLSLGIKAYSWGAAVGATYLIAWACGLVRAENFALYFAGLFFGQMCLVGHILCRKQN